MHEFLPEAVTDAKIMPLLKGKLLDFAVSDNYRPITVSTSFSKIFESIIYNRIQNELHTEDNQFGYKNKISTYM